MQISSINRSFFNFKAQFNTEDVLSFTTHFPYSKKDFHSEMVKELTGIDMKSDKFERSIPKNYEKSIVELAIISLCTDNILAQNKKLADIDSTYEPKVRSKENDREAKNWFKEQIKKLGKTIEIEPFTLEPNDINKSYKEFLEIFNKIF